MITLQEDNCTVMYSENIPYTRIDIAGLVHTAQFIEKLSDPRLFALLTEHQVSNVLLNMTQTWRVGTEDLEWIENTWLSRLSAAGVKKVSVVIVDQAYEMLRSIFHEIELNASRIGVGIRFFTDDQFYSSWEAVSWF